MSEWLNHLHIVSHVIVKTTPQSTNPNRWEIWGLWRLSDKSKFTHIVSGWTQGCLTLKHTPFPIFSILGNAPIFPTFTTWGWHQETNRAGGQAGSSLMNLLIKDICNHLWFHLIWSNSDTLFSLQLNFSLGWPIRNSTDWFCSSVLSMEEIWVAKSVNT